MAVSSLAQRLPFPDEITRHGVPWLDQNCLGTLVTSLQTLAGTLEQLKLPAGWTYFPDRQPEVLPSFVKFTKLHTLVAPQIAFVKILEWTEALPQVKNETFPVLDYSNFPEGDESVETLRREADVASTHTLPPGLRVLTVFDADQDVFGWINLVLEQAPIQYPNLAKVELLSNPSYAEADLEALRKRQIRKACWRRADGANVKTIVGRDDLVPAAWLLSL